MILNFLEKLRDIWINKKLQDDIDKLIMWFEKWQMLFNFVKLNAYMQGMETLEWTMKLQ